MPRRDETPRDLLFGLLALQIGLIDQDQLVAAFGAWSRAKGKNLAEILLDKGAIDAESRALLSAMADKQLKLHGGDTEKSLASIAAGPKILGRLAGLGDAELTASIGHVSATVPDSEATLTVGVSTSDGVRFKVLRPHAQGGLGAVYVAIDGELNREVALKQILDHHADDPVSRTRFLIEAEITGGLEHPGIVPVYGLGHYRDGRPYYAMRFIRGDSLKEAIAAYHADESLKRDPGKKSLALRKLLRRFVDVCNAIDYAHGRGILHRDIKPANVIVGKHGETLVVDWGLAKPMGHAEPSTTGERTLMPSSSSGSAETLPGSALGTPAYMSPEQARGDIDDLGPRTDVYSLGATLYCLLTGKAPFEGNDLGELLREVQKGAFPPPRQIDPTIDRALEAVCLKAMAMKIDERHATARALADDVERWSADEPTSAYIEPAAVKVRRWMRRNRTLVTAAAVAMLAALFGTAAVLAVQTRANTKLQASNTALEIANIRETKANTDLKQANTDLAAAKDREAARFNLSMEAIGVFHRGISEDFLLQQTEFVPLRDRLLRSASDFYRKLEAELSGQSDRRSRKALGLAYLELGKLTGKVASPKDAQSLLSRSVEVRRKLAEEPGADDVSRAELGRSLRELGNKMVDESDFEEASRPFQEAIAIFDRLTNVETAGSGCLDDLAEALLGMTYAQQNKDRDRAEMLVRRAVAIREGLVGEDPSDSKRQVALANALFQLGIVTSLKTVASAEAIAAYERAAAILESHAAKDREGTEDRNTLAGVYTNLGLLFGESGRPDDWKAAIDRTIAIRESVVKFNPAVAEFQNNLGHSWNTLGFFHESSGRGDEAVSAFGRGQDILEQAIKAHPESTFLKRNLAKSQLGIGRNLAKAGRTAESLKAYRQALAEQQALAELNPAVDQYRSDLAQLHHNIGLLLDQIGEPDAAIGSFRQALSVREKLVDGKPADTTFRGGVAFSRQAIAIALASMGKRDEALEEYEQVRVIRQKIADDNPTIPNYRNDLASAYTNKADILRDFGWHAEAQAGYEQAIKIREALVKDHSNVPLFRSNLAYSTRRLGLTRLASGDTAGALIDTRKAAALYEELPARSGHEWLELACCHATLAAAAGREEPGLSPSEAAAQADNVMDMLRRAVANGYRDRAGLSRESAVDPLRCRDDFKLLMLDLAFPTEAFAR